MIFQVAAEPVEDTKGTRAIAGMRPTRPTAPSRATAVPPATVSAPVVDPIEETRARGLGWVWIAVVVLVIGAVFFVLGGRP
jgi:hypothetical protein